MSLQNHGSKSETLINAKPEARGASISEVGKLKMQEKLSEKNPVKKKKIREKTDDHFLETFVIIFTPPISARHRAS